MRKLLSFLPPSPLFDIVPLPSITRDGPGRRSILSRAEHLRRLGGKYRPHQGARECARRRGDLKGGV